MAHLGSQECLVRVTWHTSAHRSVAFIHSLSKYLSERENYESPVTVFVQGTKHIQGTSSPTGEDSNYNAR